MVVDIQAVLDSLKPVFQAVCPVHLGDVVGVHVLAPVRCQFGLIFGELGSASAFPALGSCRL
jgi:hypothetical protein